MLTCMLAKVHTTSFLYIDVNGLGAVVELDLQKYIVYLLVEIVLANCVIWENNCRLFVFYLFSSLWCFEEHFPFMALSFLKVGK